MLPFSQVFYYSLRPNNIHTHTHTHTHKCIFLWRTLAPATSSSYFVMVSWFLVNYDRELATNNWKKSQRATDLLMCYRTLSSMFLCVWRHWTLFSFLKTAELQWNMWQLLLSAGTPLVRRHSNRAGSQSPGTVLIPSEPKHSFHERTFKTFNRGTHLQSFNAAIKKK